MRRELQSLCAKARRDDLECAPLLTGCGTQHPLRALGGTCILLAAAPTTPPCFRHWRRSSSLLRIISGNIIYNFAILENLRIFQNCLFTRGVVTVNGIYSAAFCESTALWSVCSPSPSRLTPCHLWRNRTLCTSAGNCTAMPRALPLGELARKRLRGRAS